MKGGLIHINNQSQKTLQIQSVYFEYVQSRVNLFHIIREHTEDLKFDRHQQTLLSPQLVRVDRVVDM